MVAALLLYFIGAVLILATVFGRVKNKYTPFVLFAGIIDLSASVIEAYISYYNYM